MSTSLFSSLFSRGPNGRRTPTIAVVLVATIVGVFFGAIAFAQDSSAQSDQAFTPVAPCAVFDTRDGLGGTTGAQTAGSVTTFVVANTSMCPGIPTGATVELNLIAVLPQANGNLKVAATGVTPGGGVVNYTTGENNSNALAVETVTNRIDVHVNGGTTHLRGVILGYYSTDLEKRVAQLETLLAGLTRETVDGQDTLRLTSANLQIVNGTNATYTTSGGATNAVGNLIIGYNQNDGTDQRTGSHNLIIGDDHTYTANGTAIFGFNNATTASGATVTGGTNNTASGSRSSVTGGNTNTASGTLSSVTGGFNNTGSGDTSSVTGGINNIASGIVSSVTGGTNNTASDANCSDISTASSVTGGLRNNASGCNSSVSGGDSNDATFSESTVSGGALNIASGNNSTVGGGRNRTAAGQDDWAAGALFEDN